MKKHLKILLHTFAFGLLVIAILPVIILGTPAAPAVGNWYQQFMPNINNRPISDITFIDSLTGFAVTPYTANDTAYILRTTNGGDLWNRVFTGPTNSIGGFNRVQFLNLNTGYVCGNFLRKTTNGGLNWNLVNTSGIFPQNMYVINEDTIWITDSDGLVGGVFRTTNGGTNWVRQLDLGSYNPNHIYFYNNRLGFICQDNIYLRRTTDGGNSWNVIPAAGGFTDLHFTDSLTGWKANGNMLKSNDGGLNWVIQNIPAGGNIITTGITKLSLKNKDTLWGIGGSVNIGGTPPTRGIVYRTINGGDNWLFQLADTSIHINRYFFICSNNKNIWAYHVSSGGIHTTTGGDPIWVTGLQQISNEIPKNYKLYQNYPNPFNPVTKIKFNITNTSSAAQTFLNVYNLLGKQVATLINSQLTPGTYEIDFDASGMASGVYFYRLTVTASKEVYTDTKKMLLIK